MFYYKQLCKSTSARLAQATGVLRLYKEIGSLLLHLQACKQISANITVLRPLKRKQDGLLSRG
jgi:hypothetical protein